MATRKPARSRTAKTARRTARRPASKPARKPAPKTARKPAPKTARRPARKAVPKAAARRAAPAKLKAPAPRPYKARRMPETLRLRAFTPSLTVDDLQRSLDFYTRVLGFLVAEKWTDDGGVLRGVMLKAGACELGISQDDWAKGRDRLKGVGMRLWCETGQDLDTLAARMRAAGGPALIGPTLESWGARTLTFDDPDGYHWTVAEPTPEEA